MISATISWGQPEAGLVAAAVIISGGLLRALWSRRARGQLQPIGAHSPHLLRSLNLRRQRLRSALVITGLALLAVSVGQPRWGEEQRQRSASGADLVLILDCSRSMLASDLRPDRMAVAQRKALDLIHANPQHRVALIPFAASHFLRCSFTGDHAALEELLHDCTPSLFPAEHGLQGTAIGATVSAAVELLIGTSDRGQAIVVLSDGSDPDGDAVAAATAAARNNGIPVYGLFIGDDERPATIEVDGASVEVPPDRSTLDQLAEGSGAISVNASIDDEDSRLIAQHIDNHVAQAPWQERQRVVGSERYHWFLIPGLLLIVAATLLTTRRREAIA
ncbi:MAG: VWA domain-containing protein [Planctomycetota bacterium]|jgi:Ca-activated chloride channel family protein